MRIVLLVLVIFFKLFGEEGDNNKCRGKVTDIIYMNGVNNTYKEASLSRFYLQVAYQKKLENLYPNEQFDFTFLYNPTFGAEDLLEVFIQKTQEEYSVSLDEEEALKYLRVLKLDVLDRIRDIENLEEDAEIIDAVIEIIKNIYGIKLKGKPLTSLLKTVKGYYSSKLALLRQNISNFETTQTFIQKIRSELLEGKRVIVVAHSQGNLFANQVYEKIVLSNSDFMDSFRVIHIATPTCCIINPNHYVTADDDMVISGLRLINDVLPGNIDNDLEEDNRDLLNHNFIKSYFSHELPSRRWIDNEFFSLVENLKYPESILGDGAIKVTLEWGNNPDVDLHIYEPNGTHVYYQNKEGSVGNLDRDDTDGKGPEHYFVNCENLQEGIYKVGVNYFQGDSPERATIQIATADGRTKSFSISLSEAKGVNGNDNPIIIATIQVIKDNNNDNYKFKIY